MKKLIALFVGIAFVAGVAGSALAQGTPAPAPAAPKEEKKAADKPAEAKKPAAQNANGTVKSAAADNIVVSGKAKGGKDAEWTFAVDPKTKIRKGGKDITAADLAAGDNVHVRYHQDGTKNVADAVMVRAAKKPAETTTSKTEPKKEEKK